MSTGRHLGEDEMPDVEPPELDDTTGTAETLTTPGAEATVVRHEERADVTTELSEAGRVRVRKHVETRPVEQTVERSVEHADTTRHEPTQDDDGEVFTLPDGSVSIPVFEEVLVVTKKLVVRERIVVQKHTTIDEHVLRTELQREDVTIDVDGDVQVDDRTRSSAPTSAPTTATDSTASTGDLSTDLGRTP